MNNSETMVRRIKELMKQKGVSNKEMSENVQNININTIAQLAKGREISYVSLANIAEYLNCSVDYLLGRTDNPNITADTYINGDNNGIQAVNNGNNSNLTVNGNTRTDTEELVEMIQGLPLVQRAKIITQIDEMKNKK